MPKYRRAAAILCIALLAFAAVLPAVCATLGGFVFVPLWTIEPADSCTMLRRVASRCDEQPVALLSTLASRAPPAGAL